MKKMFLVVAILPLIAGCFQKKNEQILSLQADSLRMTQAIAERDSSINLLFASLNEIEENLATIRMKQSLVSKQATGTREMKADVRERIQDNLADINQLLEKNRSLIASLNTQLRESNIKIAELNKTIERLQFNIEEKEQEIADLKNQLLSLNLKVEGLTQRVAGLEQESAKKTEIIDQQTSDINTAYYIVGTQRELRDLGVINREGGFIGLGRSTKFNKEFANEHFIKIDIRNFTEIELNAKRVELVTTHVAGSFELVGENVVEKLVIKNPAEFWKTSKYLVISTR